jgi:predicted MFS family arabinose efflux permease
LIAGIAATQLATAVMLFALSATSAAPRAVIIYVVLTCLQWMGGPGLASLLMNRTPEEHRSHASAMQNMVNLAAQAGSAALAGWLFGHYGYLRPLAANGLIAAFAALLLFGLLKDTGGQAIHNS